jgi:hypothetical protein
VKYLPGELLWQLKATYGLPLDIALVRLAQAGVMPVWDGLFRSAAADGADLQKLARELAFFCREAYDGGVGVELAVRFEQVAGEGFYSKVTPAFVSSRSNCEN